MLKGSGLVSFSCLPSHTLSLRRPVRSSLKDSVFESSTSNTEKSSLDRIDNDAMQTSHISSSHMQASERMSMLASWFLHTRLCKHANTYIYSALTQHTRRHVLYSSGQVSRSIEVRKSCEERIDRTNDGRTTFILRFLLFAHAGGRCTVASSVGFECLVSCDAQRATAIPHTRRKNIGLAMHEYPAKGECLSTRAKALLGPAPCEPFLDLQPT
jgi:hypothetical protein